VKWRQLFQRFGSAGRLGRAAIFNVEGAYSLRKLALNRVIKMRRAAFVELYGAVLRSYDSPYQWTFELDEEYGECEE